LEFVFEAIRMEGHGEKKMKGVSCLEKTKRQVFGIVQTDNKFGVHESHI